MKKEEHNRRDGVGESGKEENVYNRYDENQHEPSRK